MFPEKHAERPALWALLQFDQREKDSETYEITGLDIGCKRAMFRKYQIICCRRGTLHYNTLGALHCQPEIFPTHSRFSRPQIIFQAQEKEEFEWRNGK
jgi:hypothetical protein